MDDQDVKFALGLCRIISAAICIIVLFISGCCAHQNWLFANKGYIQGSVPGVYGSVWVKPQ